MSQPQHDQSGAVVHANTPFVITIPEATPEDLRLVETKTTPRKALEGQGFTVAGLKNSSIMKVAKEFLRLEVTEAEQTWMAFFDQSITSLNKVNQNLNEPVPSNPVFAVSLIVSTSNVPNRSQKNRERSFDIYFSARPIIKPWVLRGLTPVM